MQGSTNASKAKSPTSPRHSQAAALTRDSSSAGSVEIPTSPRQSQATASKHDSPSAGKANSITSPRQNQATASMHDSPSAGKTNSSSPRHRQATAPAHAPDDAGSAHASTSAGPEEGSELQQNTAQACNPENAAGVEKAVGVPEGGSASMLAALQRLDANTDAAQSHFEHDASAVEAETQHVEASSGPPTQEAFQPESASSSQDRSATAVEHPTTAVAEADNTAPGAQLDSTDGSRAVSEGPATAAGSPSSGPRSRALSGGSSPVTPAATSSFRLAVGRVLGLEAAEMQSPNKKKYGRSESRGAGLGVDEHPVGESAVNSTL